MAKDIYISQSCSENCMAPHNRGRDHRTMDVKRFKTRFSQYLSIDDEYWFQAFQKIQSLSDAFKEFNKNFNKKLVEKRLNYTLDYDTHGKLFEIFKQANDQQYNKLTCSDVALIQSRINKNRNPQPAQIKSIVKEFLKEQGEVLKQKIDRIMGREFDQRNARRQDKRQRYQRQVEEKPANRQGDNRRRDRDYDRDRNREGQRQRDRPRRRVYQKEEDEERQQNSLKTLKVNEVEESNEDNFNIVAKIIRINKTFSIGQSAKRRIQFEGGDETGTAIFVVNALKMIKAGVVIKISNAKIFHFHGTMQIQQQYRNSHLEQIRKNMLVSSQYVLHQKKKNYTSKNNDASFSHRTRPSERQSRNYRNQNQENRQDRRGYRDYGRNDQYRRRERQPQVSQTSSRPQRRQRRGQGRYREGQRVQYRNREGQRPQYRNREGQDRRDRRNREGQRRRQQQNTKGQRREMGQQNKRQRERRPARRNRYQDSQQEKADKMTQKNIQNQQNYPPRPSKRASKRNYTSQSESEKDQHLPMAKVESKKVEQATVGKKKPTKIKDIDPQDQNLNIVAEILQVSHQNISVGKGNLFCVIADDTGLIWAQLPKTHASVKENVVVFLESVQAAVHEQQHKLIIRLTEDSLLHRTSIKLSNVNLNINMSEQVWVPQDEEEEEEEEEEEVQEEQSEQVSVKKSVGKQPESSIIEDF